MNRVLAVMFAVAATAATPRLTVLHPEGLVHGFLVLRSMDGATIANGDLLQTARGDIVTSRLVFHFKDGSLQDETAVFSQRGELRLRSDRLVQKGPSFPTPIDLTVDAASGRATVHYTDGHGETRTETERLDSKLPLANGLLLVALKNVRAGATPPRVSLVVATPKPRVVTLAVAPDGRVPFTTGTERREAVEYTVKVELGGVAGVVAPLVGKQPPDSHVWILQGDAPAFVKAEEPFYSGGPIWRIELVGPVF